MAIDCCKRWEQRRSSTFIALVAGQTMRPGQRYDRGILVFQSNDRGIQKPLMAQRCWHWVPTETASVCKHDSVQ
jgi:hypothetical protein